MPIALSEEFSPGRSDFAVVLTLYERAGIIANVLDSLVRTVVGRWELAIVCDRGRDDTPAAAVRAVRAQSRPTCAMGALLHRVIVFHSTFTLYETAAENIGMRLLDPAIAFVLVQPDAVYMEDGWNAALASALLTAKKSTNVTIAFVSARCGIPGPHYVAHMARHAAKDTKQQQQQPPIANPCGGFVRTPRATVEPAVQRTAYLANHVPRGPLVVGAWAMRALGYWPEECGFHGTEAPLLMTRARQSLRWHAAYVYADVYQDPALHQSNYNSTNLADPQRPFPAFPAAAYVGYRKHGAKPDTLPWCVRTDSAKIFDRVVLDAPTPRHLLALARQRACDPLGLETFAQQLANITREGVLHLSQRRERPF